MISVVPVMTILPYKTFTLQTTIPLAQVKQRLAKHIEAPKLVRWQFSRAHAPYQGTLSDEGFQIRRIIHYRNSFLPDIQGWFETSPERTTVHITMQLHPLVLAFMCAWFGLWYMGALPIALFGGISPLMGVFILGMPMLILGVFLSVFNYEMERSHRELTKIITGKRILQQQQKRSPWVRNLCWVGGVMALSILLHQLSLSQPPGLPLEQTQADCAQGNNPSPYCQLTVTHQLDHPSVRSLAMANDGQTLVSGGEDKAIRIWDVATGQLTKTLQSDSGIVEVVAIAPDGNTVVSGGGDRMVRIWDLTSDQSPQVLAGHQNIPNQIAISADGKTVISTAYSEIKLWDLATGELKATLLDAAPTEVSWGPLTLKQTSQARPLAISPDGGSVLVDNQGKWLLWDISARQATHVPMAASAFVQDIDISPGGQFATTVSYRQPITFFKVWDLTTGKLTTQGRLSSSPQQHSLNNLVVSRDPTEDTASVHIIGSNPQGLKVWTLENKRLNASLTTTPMTSLVSSQDSRVLAGIVPTSKGQTTKIHILQRPE